MKVYQEELESRKNIDIFAQPSSAELLRLLKPETDIPTTEAQAKMETMFVEKGITKYSKTFQNKMPESLDRPLEKEPIEKVSIPKPEPRGEDQDPALDGLLVLDKQRKSKTFGFYGRDVHYSHGNACNLVKYRKAEVQHPCAKFDIAAKDFIEIYCNLFFEKPTPEEYFYQKAIAYTYEDHRLKMADATITEVDRQFFVEVILINE